MSPRLPSMKIQVLVKAMSTALTMSAILHVLRFHGTATLELTMLFEYTVMPVVPATLR